MSLGATASEVSTRHLAKAWFALALFALGASAVLAIVLVAARTPFLAWAARSSGQRWCCTSIWA